MNNEIPPIVAWHLANWARWMRSPGMKLGFPAKAAVLECGGISGDDAFDVLCEEADEYAAVAMNAIIDSLEPAESAAIHHRYLHSVYRLRDLEETLTRALGRVWRGMLARGLA